MALGEEDFFDGYFDGFPIETTPENMSAVREFLLEKWLERYDEVGRGAPRPTDLSDSCKFSALFGTVVFGADVGGNYDHVHNVLDGEVIDINAHAADVVALADPYRQDEAFLRSEGLFDSLVSCSHRVETWIEDFRDSMPTPRPSI
jgi:hypothetical protein